MPDGYGVDKEREDKRWRMVWMETMGVGEEGNEPAMPVGSRRSGEVECKESAELGASGMVVN